MSNFEIIPLDALFKIFSYLTITDFLNFTEVTGYPFMTYLKNKDELYLETISYYLYTKCRSEELFIYLRECFDITIPLEYNFYKLYKLGIPQEKSNILALKCAIQLRDIEYIKSSSLLIENKNGGYPENWVSATCNDYRKNDMIDSVPNVFNSLLYAADGDEEIEDILWNKLKWFTCEYTYGYITYYQVTDGYDLTVMSFHNGKLEQKYCLEDYFN